MSRPRVHQGWESRLRILFLAPRHPAPAWRGDQVRVLELARGLAARAEVKLVSFGPPDAEPLADLAATVITPSLRGRLSENLRRPSPRLPGQVRLFLDRAMSAGVEELVRSWRPDVVHATLARMAPYLPPPGTVHRHLDLVDSLALNMRSRAQSGRLPTRVAFSIEAGLMDGYERRSAAAADSASVVSDADRVAAGLGAEAVIPNGVDLGRLRFSDPRDRPRTMIFFGNLGYFHNVAPASFLATEVLPRVRTIVPGVEVTLAGARPASAVRRAAALEDVKLVEGPADLVAVLHRAAVAVLPMFSGSGIKNKVLEAFSVGLPVVANRAGVEGVTGVEPGVHFLLAESADEIAAACARLLEDGEERSRLAAAGRSLVEENYTWDRQVDRLLSLYRG
jgi:glycosyltransferase involved in cell wall biosynthesis